MTGVHAAAIGIALVLFGCTRSRETAADAGADDAAPDARLTASDAAPGKAHEAPLGDVPATGVEARRSHLDRLDDEPGLAKNEAAIRAHFGGTIPASMRLQAVPLAAGRQALLVESDVDEPRPFVLAVDATGTALWTRERPTAGISPPVTQLALAPRAENGVALFLFDAPTHLVAVRMWDAEGYPFADMQLFELPRCDALSVAWWPSHGWVVVATHAGAARAQLVHEDGTTAWGKTGIDVGEPWRGGPAPATIVLDGQPGDSQSERDDGWMLLQYATRANADHVLAFRFNAFGNSTWKGPVDLGAIKRSSGASARVDASRPAGGVARVVLGDRAVDVRADGSVSPAAPPPRIDRSGLR